MPGDLDGRRRNGRHDRTAPLVPALQNNLLLTTHVAVAILAYGTFAVSFGAAVLYLVHPRVPAGLLPEPGLLDEIGYRSITVGFPLMALVIVLGALLILLMNARPQGLLGTSRVEIG